ncbi:MAG TPA: hypothetical protein VJ385_15585 [Fibrobacteria bacterium]|nr:hypothetical protein [Fibrobacteria bacterium]
MEASLQVLMNGLIDYAGLFPPASLDMGAAVRNFAAYRKGPHSAWLGRFVLPASRLGEFANANARLPQPPGSEGMPWRLSVLIRSDLPGDFKNAADFNKVGPSLGQPAIVDTLEMKADRPEAILQALEALPPGIMPYFEIPIQEDPAPLLAAMARAGGRAKIRTGGVTPAQFPAPEVLARFLIACAAAGVPFKATAGLHHPLRALRRLTDAPESPTAVMHGFLNLFLAAAFARDGMDAETLVALLREESPRAFSFRGEGASWRGHKLAGSGLLETRRDFAIAFGSCSFEDPELDLGMAGWL